jgi:hypothetical protein
MTEGEAVVEILKIVCSYPRNTIQCHYYQETGVKRFSFYLHEYSGADMEKLYSLGCFPYECGLAFELWV